MVETLGAHGAGMVARHFEDAEFEIFTQRLLLRELDRVPASEAHACIMEAALLAACGAKSTAFPFLVFPCLFEEHARAATNQFLQREETFWSTFNLEFAQRQEL